MILPTMRVQKSTVMEALNSRTLRQAHSFNEATTHAAEPKKRHLIVDMSLRLIVDIAASKLEGGKVNHAPSSRFNDQLVFSRAPIFNIGLLLVEVRM